MNDTANNGELMKIRRVLQRNEVAVRKQDVQQRFKQNKSTDNNEQITMNR